jgi:hypothetical protein
MRSLKGLSIRETAEALGLTESAVKSRITRALAELRRLNDLDKRPAPQSSYSTGARATALSPARKNTNIQASSVFERRGAAANSRQTKTPQQAETIVAPWPME